MKIAVKSGAMKHRISILRSERRLSARVGALIRRFRPSKRMSLVLQSDEDGKEYFLFSFSSPQRAEMLFDEILASRRIQKTFTYEKSRLSIGRLFANLPVVTRSGTRPEPPIP